MSEINNSNPMIDNYNYKVEAGPIRRALWFCAGADPQLMARCPHSERVKEEGIGGVILATAFLAFASGSYALNFVFGSPWLAIFAGFVWGLVIFNLDRFIITSTGHGDGTNDIGGKELLYASPRIVMAIIIGVCLSAPLEIRIFQTEIESVLQQENDKKLASRSKIIEADFAKTYERNNAEIKRIHTSIDEVEANYIMDTAEKNKEATRIFNQKAAESSTGVGPRTEYLQKSYENMMAVIADREARFKTEKMDSQTKVQALKEETAIALAKKDAKLEKMKNETLKIDGLAVRLHIMHEQFPWQSAFLMALLMMIEITPVITKMMLRNESYYYLMENQHQIVIAKYAIETKTSIGVAEGASEAGEISNAEEKVQVTYYQAESVLKAEKGKLEVESALTEDAQLAFKEQKSDDIKKNPNKYVSDSRPTDEV